MLTVMNANPEIRDENERSPEASRGQGTIEFRHLSFLYGTREVLSDVSFSVKAGETVAIVGATGSGKSTLVNLLPRLQNPPRGTVFVDGRDVRDIPLKELRGMIGFVPQEPFLFSDTLADNLAFGVPGAAQLDRARVEAAAGVAQLDKDVETSRTATRRWSASAGSRCRADRSSAPRSLAPSSQTRAS
jgi:ATP-binding cassette subfamily B protein